MIKEIKWVPINEIKPNKKNRNSHSEEQIKRLADIITYQGFRTPLIVSNRTGLLVAGHGRLLAAKQLSLKSVPVSYQDFDSEEQEYAAGISDNAIASWSELDLSGINQDIPELGPDFNLEMLGIKDFVLEPADKYGDKDADAVHETRTTSICLGDLYSLGNHRLLCGDSTDATQVERLMSGEKADMVFTDPPYGMNLDTDYSKINGSKNASIKGGGKTYHKVIGDDKPFDPSHLLDMADEVFLWGADYYHSSLPEDGSWMVWDKRGSEDGDKIIGNVFELCWSKQRHKKEIARIFWMGAFGDAEARDRVHPTQKPTSLVQWFFERWGKDAKLIVDLYLGSGSTLIACEKTNRKCYGMEIDPQYCQVIIDRFEKFTGQKAVKV